MLGREEAAGVEEPEVRRGHAGVQICQRTAGNGDAAVGILDNVRRSGGNGDAGGDRRRDGAGRRLGTNLPGVDRGASALEVYAVRAYVANFQDKATGELPLDAEVPLLCVGSVEVP